MRFRRHHHDVNGTDERLDVIIELLEDILVELRPQAPTATIVFKGLNMTSPTGPTPGPITINDDQTVSAGIALSDNPDDLSVTSVVWSVVGTDATSTPSTDTLTTSVAGVPGADGDTTLNAEVTLSNGTVINATTTVTTQVDDTATATATIVFGTPS
jgi:hypothetical protein